MSFVNKINNFYFLIKLVNEKKGLVPVLFFRKHFTTDINIKSAKVYSTAQGAYKMMINGQLISDYELSPGDQDFRQSIQYQGYEVTHLLKKENALGALVATGRFSGYTGSAGQFNVYGSDQNLLLELHIEYENNTKRVVKTDNSWKVMTGPLIYSDILMGELYYENRVLTDWASPQYNDKDWLPVVSKPIDKNVELVADRAQPIRVTQELKPKTKYQSSPGVWVFDFEQNMVGWVRIHFKAQTKASRIQLRHAEMLQPNGQIYTLNLRSALATDTYVLQSKTYKEKMV